MTLQNEIRVRIGYSKTDDNTNGKQPVVLFYLILLGFLSCFTYKTDKSKFLNHSRF